MENSWITTNDKVDLIRQALDQMNGGEFSVQYKPIKSFTNKLEYPLEFQVFMEKIGELEINSKSGSGYRVLCLEAPQPLIGPHHEDSSLVILDTYKENDDLGGYVAGGVSVIASDVDAFWYGFLTNKKPFQFVAQGLYEEHKSFLPWIIKFLLNAIEYVSQFDFERLNVAAELLKKCQID